VSRQERAGRVEQPAVQCARLEPPVRRIGVLKSAGDLLDRQSGQRLVQVRDGLVVGDGDPMVDELLVAAVAVTS